MRVRCPHNGCSFDVADDMAGARIRCPHCERLLFVDGGPDDEAAAAEPEDPAGAPADRDTGVYAGLPPLSVLLALREGRPPGRDAERAARAEMTADDWQALAVFEHILRVTAALQLALGCGIVAGLLTVAAWAVEPSPGWGIAVPAGRWWSRLATAAIIGAGLLVMEVARSRLHRLRVDETVGLARWAAVAVVLAFVANVAVNLFAFAGDQSAACLALFATPVQLAAIMTAALAGWQALQAHGRLGPPEVLTRLAEAMALLEQRRRRLG